MSVCRSFGLACFLGLSFIGSSFATTRYVNVSNAAPAAPYTNWGIASTNIQAAITAAASGDEILVAPGVYRIELAVGIPGDKKLTLRSTQSRAAIIDAQRLCRGVVIFGANSVVEGFTVRNGLDAGYAGGIYTEVDCTVRDCLVISNQAYGAAGVFIYGAATVENCTIRNNQAAFGGGVMFYAGTTGVVRNCAISDNVASNYGGGVYIQYGGMLSNCWISGNRVLEADAGGGGVYMSAQGTPVGGTLVNSVVCDNSSSQDGGGIYCAGAAGILSPVNNCTVVSNAASRFGGGIFANNTRMINDILYFNAAPTGANLYEDNFCMASNCCVTPLPATNAWACFTNAPSFVDFAARNFHLAAASPCIDAGATNNAPGNDYDGNPRPAAGVQGGPAKYDVGAFEYQVPVEICDGLDNDGDGQIDEDCRAAKTCFSFNQSVRCTGAGWSRTFVMDLTNFRNLAVQDGYQSFTVNYSLYYNIWTGIYLYGYDSGKFDAVTWAMNLDL